MRNGFLLAILLLYAHSVDAGERTDLWSFRPPANPVAPQVADAAWPRDDLDRFILARLEKAGLKPNPAADAHTLLRRIAFDLTGLPPTPEEIAEFEKSAIHNPQSAIEAAVDRYLASPRFGERWGRHWLDVVRYADSVGRTWNAPFTYAWRYRDYVIDCFNRDMPYDRFITEQLAGDLLSAKTVQQEREQLIATGFLTLGSLPLNDGRIEGFVMDRVDDQIDVTTRAFLGLTVACARCHDHKYDPITTRDYYSLAGIFYSTRTLPGQAYRGNLGRGGYVDAAKLMLLPNLPGDPVRDGTLEGIHSMTDYQEEWQRSHGDIRYTTDPDLAMGVLEGDVRDCEIRVKGEPNDRGEAPPRGEMQIPGLPRLPPIPSHESGRLQLARWITSSDNPLTARVMANRIWRHLFGRGLASTVDNFGVNSEPPTHPELLDHLATRFVDGGWSMKGLIRAIVLSRTYQLSSDGREPARSQDPRNELYWRKDMRRLEVEALRDSLLAMSGRLELRRPEGIQVAGTGGKGKNGVVRSLLSVESPYRTVYLPVLRSMTPQLYSTFDFPDPCQVSGQREVTTVAPQALFFMNNDFVSDCAADAADALLEQPKLDNAGRIRAAYVLVFGRTPQADELQDSLELLASSKPQGNRWATFLQALMASGEFRYVP